MELLVPAGNYEAFLAGINNGADAVYIGGQNYSARQNAQNFSLEEIKKSLEYAHLRNKKVYITANTLIDQPEFEDALDYIYNLYTMGVDAVIVQDLGLLEAVKRLIPHLRLHASTQMTIHNGPGALFLKQEGIARVVLAREMSLEDLKLIRQETPNVELEVFAHGAVCYSYSGQCLFSSMVGGRSGNRGRCAGPCRLPYELYNQAGKYGLDKGNYLLSTADLCLINYLAELNVLGIDSIKIEGRMKRPEYVAIVTKAYRESIAKLYANEENSRQGHADLLKVFNRNFSTGYLVKGNEPAFLSRQRPDNRGDYLGKVIKQDSYFKTRIRLEAELNIGDGIEIWRGQSKGLASIVRELSVNEKPVITAKKGDIATIQLDTKVASDDAVYKNRDVLLLNRAGATINETINKIEVEISLILEKDRPLKLIMADNQGRAAIAYGTEIAREALNRPLSKEDAASKAARLGDTPFTLKDFYFSNPDNLLVSFSDLNDTRRRASQALLDLCLKRGLEDEEVTRDSFVKLKKQYTTLKKPAAKNNFTKLSVFTSSLEGAQAAIEAGADLVYMALENIAKPEKIKPDALISAANLARSRGTELIPALPRIQKPHEFNQGSELLELGFNKFMISNLGALNWCRENHLSASTDYTLNIFNPYALRFILDKNVSTICLSPELTLKQINQFPDLSKAELVVHGELILMVSEYCMLSGVLGNGASYCKEKYCRRDKYYIKDEKGYAFPIETDRNCRFYVFNSRTLCMVENLDKLIRRGPCALRIEAYRLDKEQIAKTVGIYRRVLDQLYKEIIPDLSKSKQELEQISNSALTKGHYYRGVL